MRVIAGRYKGRRLKMLEGMDVRPTSDRLRETLFNVLAPRIAGTRFLDLCAGSGAVGIEALSRGAEQATFVEQWRKAAAVIAENVALCGITTDFKIIQREAMPAIKRLADDGQQFDLIYFDPPYDAGIYSPVLRGIVSSGLLAEDGIVIAEHRRQLPLAPSYDDLRPYRELAQGESLLTFYRLERGAEVSANSPVTAPSAPHGDSL